jgi:hypothetical protein
MSFSVRRLLILLLLLLPSAQFAWRNRVMPQFSYLHDDGILFVTAKSIAHGEFRIASLPENPPQTKAPPLYPLFLSMIWRFNPNFPDNLVLSTGMSWLVLVAFFGFVSYFLLTAGLRESRAWIVISLIALNPYLILFGCTMFSEVFFTCFVIATFLAIRKPGMRWAIAAGVLAAAAYLSRTAGIALLVSVPIFLTLKRDWRRAVGFVLPMLTAVIGWTLWTGAHHVHPMDDTLMYYTDYTGYEFLNVGVSNIAIVLWKNLDGLLYGMGSLVLPSILPGLLARILTQVIAVAMIVGVVRLFRRGIMQEYAAFALLSCCILLAWHFPPNERFVLPLLPLLIAGLVTECEHLADMVKGALKHKDFGQRAVAGAMAAGVAIVLGGAVITQGYVTFKYLNESAEQKSIKLAAQRVAFMWMKGNLPADANVLSYDDPLLYLYTGHRGNYLPLLTKWWYADDQTSPIEAYKNVAEYCASRNLQYFYFTTQDLDREVGEEGRARIEKVVRANPHLYAVYEYGIGTVYKIKLVGTM